MRAFRRTMVPLWKRIALSLYISINDNDGASRLAELEIIELISRRPHVKDGEMQDTGPLPRLLCTVQKKKERHKGTKLVRSLRPMACLINYIVVLARNTQEFN